MWRHLKNALIEAATEMCITGGIGCVKRGTALWNDVRKLVENLSMYSSRQNRKAKKLVCIDKRKANFKEGTKMQKKKKTQCIVIPCIPLVYAVIVS